MKNRRLIGAIVGANLVLLLGGWFLLVSPQRNHSSTAAQELKQTQDELTKLGASAGKLSHPKQPLIKTAALYRLAQAMPTSADEPDLMLGLDQLARSAGVKVLGISPATPTGVAGGYTQIPLTLTLQGSYGSLTRYLHSLRMLVSVRHGALHATGRLFSVTSVALAPGASGKTEQATVSLDAYGYGTLAGATPPPSTTTGTTSTTTTSG
ncbi:MAG: type 4a pilus biogenesis protein PilO [Gaiellaceae bacterium]